VENSRTKGAKLKPLSYIFLLVFLFFATGCSVGKSFQNLNEIRQKEGLKPLTYNINLECSSLAHAAYIVKNLAISHEQSPDGVGFTGKTPTDRGSACGYHSPVLENLTFNAKDLQDAFDGLMGAIYHRFTFLNPRVDEIGIGVHQGKQRGYVFNLGNSKVETFCKRNKGVYFGSTGFSGLRFYGFCKNKSLSLSKEAYDQTRRLTSAKFVIYPHRTPSAISFNGEVPDPFPTCKITSNPVSIEFVDDSVKMVSFKIFDERGRELTNTKILTYESDPNQLLNSRQFALFSAEVFDFDSKYNVAFVYDDVDGKRYKVSWNFRTVKPKGKYFVVHGGERLKLKRDVLYTIFLKPDDCNDLAGGYSMRRADAKTDRKKPFSRMSNANTIEVKLNAYSAKEYVVTFTNGKKVFVEME